MFIRTVMFFVMFSYFMVIFSPVGQWKLPRKFPVLKRKKLLKARWHRARVAIRIQSLGTNRPPISCWQARMKNRMKPCLKCKIQLYLRLLNGYKKQLLSMSSLTVCFMLVVSSISGTQMLMASLYTWEKPHIRHLLLDCSGRYYGRVNHKYVYVNMKDSQRTLTGHKNHKMMCRRLVSIFYCCTHTVTSNHVNTGSPLPHDPWPCPTSDTTIKHH